MQMDPERYRQVKQIFTEASGLPATERESFLTEACGEDHELRREVEELLRSQDAADEGALGKALSPEGHVTEIPEYIGPYRLIDRIGEGGMGEVFLAEQFEPIARTVALKIIRPGLESKSVLARFDSERQALAMMDHRNIARALDAGTMEDGRPYFVMEYVSGIPLTDYCDQNFLPTNERLELLAQVCDGLHHAHQKAIIHRDIKPSNVLVTMRDGHPVPKIIDFGIAKAAAQPLTERTLFTELGQVIGTPEYMSPEQAELTGDNVDTRTDIYSLGVLMYEVLVGVLPFDPDDLRRGAFDEILRRIREDEPPKPSTRLGTLDKNSADAIKRRKTTVNRLSSELRGDLDWITMKALEKDPSRRYRSATEMADDIRRYLKFEPVSAGPPGAAYRLQKFARRHRVGVSFGALATAFLAIFVYTTTTQAGVIAKERDRANEEAEGSREIADFLVGLFRRADPGRAKGAEVTAKEILDAGAREIEKLDDKPLSQAAFAETIGEVYGVMGLFEEGQALLERAHEIRKGIGTDTREAELALAATKLDLGTLLILGRKTDLGLPLAQESMAIYERLLPNSLELASSLNSVGNALKELGKYEEAEALHMRTLEIRERYEDDPESGLSASLHNLGSSRFMEGDLEGAERYYRRAIEVSRKVEGEKSNGMATTQHTLAMVLAQLGRYAEAVPLEESSLAIREEVLGPDHPHVALSLRTLSEIMTQVGEGERAEPLARRAAEIGHAAWGPDTPDVWWMKRGHAEVLNAIGQHVEALEVMEALLEIVEAAPRRVEYALHLAECGNALRGLKRWTEARARYEKAIQVSTDENGADSAWTAELELGFARVLRDEGLTGEAKALYEKALANIAKERDTSDPYYARGKAELDAMK